MEIKGKYARISGPERIALRARRRRIRVSELDVYEVNADIMAYGDELATLEHLSYIAVSAVEQLELSPQKSRARRNIQILSEISRQLVDYALTYQRPQAKA